jgi:hypothetical protein
MAKAATKTCDRPLSTFQLAFGQAFYSTSSETYGNRTKSAIVAGYSAKTAQQQGGQLAKHPGIRARFSGLANANPAVAAVEEEITRGLVIKDLRRIQGLAEDDEDWGTALRAEELIGKTAGIFIQEKRCTDGISLDISPKSSPQSRAWQSCINGNLLKINRQS